MLWMQLTASVSCVAEMAIIFSCGNSLSNSQLVCMRLLCILGFIVPMIERKSSLLEILPQRTCLI
jgi:hypothetical protein